MGPEHPQDSEAALVQRASSGDRKALGALYERYATRIYQFMLYRTGSTAVAEDLTSEVFADVITGIQDYEYRGIPFRAWLFRIARARLVDHWRSRERRNSYHEAWAQSQKIELPDHGSLDDLFEYETLIQALEYLTEIELEVVLLRFVGDLTNREIATIVQSNENAVKSRMRRALTKLRSVLESRRDAEGRH